MRFPLQGAHVQRHMSDLLAPETIIHGAHAEYRIISLIGRGGDGGGLPRAAPGGLDDLGVKEMRPAEDLPTAELEENRRLFLQEAELLSKLSHPGLPVVAELFEYQGRPGDDHGVRCGADARAPHPRRQCATARTTGGRLRHSTGAYFALPPYAHAADHLPRLEAVKTSC